LYSSLRRDLSEELFSNIDFYEQALSGKYPDDSLHAELFAAAEEADDDGAENQHGFGKELSPLHVFGLANLLQRPIILYSAPQDFVNSNAGIYLPTRTGQARLPDGKPVGPLLVAWSSPEKRHFVSLIPVSLCDQDSFCIPAKTLPRNPDNDELLVFAYDGAKCQDYMEDGHFLVRGRQPHAEFSIENQVDVWRSLWQDKNPEKNWFFEQAVGQRRRSAMKDLIRQSQMQLWNGDIEEDDEEEEDSQADAATRRVIILRPGGQMMGTSSGGGLQQALFQLANALPDGAGDELLRGFSDAAKASSTADLVESLVDMGFDEVLARKACIATSNQGIEEATHWILASPDTSESEAASPGAVIPATGVKWQSQDPRTGMWVPYDEAVGDSLEEQFQAGQCRGKIIVAGRFFTVDFGEMEQINNMGYGRPIQRVAPTAEAEANSEDARHANAGCDASLEIHDRVTSNVSTAQTDAEAVRGVMASGEEHVADVPMTRSPSLVTGRLDGFIVEKDGEQLLTLSMQHDTDSARSVGGATALIAAPSLVRAVSLQQPAKRQLKTEVLRPPELLRGISAPARLDLGVQFQPQVR
jgi:hypothetical protein